MAADQYSLMKCLDKIKKLFSKNYTLPSQFNDYLIDEPHELCPIKKIALELLIE